MSIEQNKIVPPWKNLPPDLLRHIALFTGVKRIDCISAYLATSSNGFKILGYELLHKNVEEYLELLGLKLEGHPQAIISRQIFFDITGLDSNKPIPQPIPYTALCELELVYRVLKLIKKDFDEYINPNSLLIANRAIKDYFETGKLIAEQDQVGGNIFYRILYIPQLPRHFLRNPISNCMYRRLEGALQRISMSHPAIGAKALKNKYLSSLIYGKDREPQCINSALAHKLTILFIAMAGLSLLSSIFLMGKDSWENNTATMPSSRYYQGIVLAVFLGCIGVAIFPTIQGRIRDHENDNAKRVATIRKKYLKAANSTKQATNSNSLSSPSFFRSLFDNAGHKKTKGGTSHFSNSSSSSTHTLAFNSVASPPPAQILARSMASITSANNSTATIAPTSIASPGGLDPLFPHGDSQKSYL
jgi:hypothetical protein